MSDGFPPTPRQHAELVAAALRTRIGGGHACRLCWPDAADDGRPDVDCEGCGGTGMEVRGEPEIEAVCEDCDAERRVRWLAQVAVRCGGELRCSCGGRLAVTGRVPIEVSAAEARAEIDESIAREWARRAERQAA